MDVRKWRPFPGLDQLILTGGQHDEYEGACLIEAVGWLRHMPWGIVGGSMSIALAIYGRHLNDSLLIPPPCNPYYRPELEPQLRAFIPRLVSTCDEGDEERAWRCLDDLIRSSLPAWSEEAAALRDLPPQTSPAALAASRVMRQSVCANIAGTPEPVSTLAVYRTCYPASVTATNVLRATAAGNAVACATYDTYSAILRAASAILREYLPRIVHRQQERLLAFYDSII